MPSLITLCTDFGLRDSYVAEMKGVLFSNCPNANVVDISHEVPACDVLHGARLLAQCVQQFPAPSIHVGVIDPGVGSHRRRIVLKAKLEQGEMFFVGPDNGLFSLVLTSAELISAWQIDSIPAGITRGSSTTFDGRDIFCPAAVLLAKGNAPEEFCSPLQLESAPLVQLYIPEPRVRTDGSIHGEVVSFDHFGNAVTNIHREVLDGNNRSYRGKIASHEIADNQLAGLQLDWVTHYEEIAPNSAALLFNSQGYVEIAARQQSAKDLLKLAKGDECQLLPA